MTTPHQPDLRALAVEAILAAESWTDTDQLADAVLAAVLPAHRDMVLEEAAQAILDHADDEAARPRRGERTDDTSYLIETWLRESADIVRHLSTSPTRTVCGN